VDNTSDVNKPVSTATQTALNDKANKTDIHNAAVPWTTNHTLADGTRYLANDIVHDGGKIYKAKFDNESIPTSNTTYWEEVGAGYRLNIDGRDISNIPYPVTGVSGRTGDIVLTKDDVGLNNVDNTSDANKPVSTATQTALDGKASSAHTHISNDISDATSFGKDILTASSYAAQNKLGWEIVTGSITAAAGGQYVIPTTPSMPVGPIVISDPATASNGDSYTVIKNGGGSLNGVTLGGVNYTGYFQIYRVYVVSNVFPFTASWQSFTLDRFHNHAISGVTGLQTALDAKAPLTSPTFTGTVSGITKSMVGLGNVDNTSDANKPVSTATQTALDGKASSSHVHAIGDVTGLQTALDNKQTSGDYATLTDGKVPSSQLPSYVDDVIEATNLAALPVSGETGKIYVTLDSNKVYRWSGSAYVEISPSPGSTDSVTEGSVNLYYTNSRASAAAPVQSVNGSTGIVTIDRLVKDDKTVILGSNGSVTLPSGSILSETSNTISLMPPTALSGQSLVIRPTAALWAISSSNYIEYGNPITIVVTLQSWAYFGTVNYTISGTGITPESLGRSLTGKLTFVSTDGPDAESITWTIPANSNISEFTLTLTSVDGTLSDGSPEQTDPTLYYDFEENAMPIGQFVTVTNDGMSNSEHSHVHLVAGDPSTVDIYLGDDDQYVKIQKDGGDVIIGTDSNTHHWTFDNNGNLTIPASGDILDSNGTSILNSKAPLASPTFTGTVNGITSSMVGLGNVDNTSDANKPISTAQQTALDLKLESSDLNTDLVAGSGIELAFNNTNSTLTISSNVISVAGRTGAVTLTKSDVDLGNVDNTSDANKPVSTATQTSLDLKAPLTNPTFSGNIICQNLTAVDAVDSGLRCFYNSDSLVMMSGTTIKFGVNSFGIVSTGQWMGSTIGVAYGGTGATTATGARTNLELDNNYITNLGSVSGSTPINYDTNRSIQTLTLGGTATTFTKGTGWPTSSNISVDTVLRITVTSATSITWTVVTDWFNQPPAGALGVGTHLVLLRAIGASTIEGHYIGSKTN
jgi:hypothetical protein